MLQLSHKYMLQLLLAPTDGPGDAAPAGDSKEDIIKFLGEGDDEPETIDLTDKKKVKGEKEEKEEKEEVDEGERIAGDEDIDDEDVDDDLKDIEDELEGPTEEQLELMTPVRRREILKKYPNLFKDFPYLERAYYREQQFTELLPTIEDAKLAVEKSGTLDSFEKELMGGSIETILKAVHKESPRSFAKIADEYLITLSRVDEKAYHHVLGNTIKHTIVAMVNEARASKNESLQSAAQILNQFVFGSSEFAPPTQLSGRENPEEKGKETELSKRERELNNRQFEGARDDLNGRVNNILKATIEGNIDPKDSMTAYVKRNASREALESLQTLIERDSRFKNLLDKLWEKAFDDKFSKVSVDRIRSAYVSKAKTLLPSVIKKARIEALKGMGKRVREESDEQEVIKETDRKGPIKPGKPASQSAGKIKSAKDIPQGMSTLEFLNSD